MSMTEECIAELERITDLINQQHIVIAKANRKLERLYTELKSVRTVGIS